jgi:hypothetical protein
VRPVAAEQPRQLDRVLERQLGARADGEVRGVHRVAHQHDMAARPLCSAPAAADHALEVQPGRAAQVRALDISAWPSRWFANSFSQKAMDALVVLVQAVRLPDVLGRLDDEGRGGLVELVDVGLEPAVFGLLEQRR